MTGHKQLNKIKMLAVILTINVRLSLHFLMHSLLFRMIKFIYLPSVTSQYLIYSKNIHLLYSFDIITNLKYVFQILHSITEVIFTKIKSLNHKISYSNIMC